MKKRLILFTAAALMTLGSASLFACGYCYGDDYHGCGYGRGYRNGRGYHGHNRGGRNYYAQDLTQEQIAQIEELENKYIPQLGALRDEIYMQNQIINLEMYKSNPDQNVINTALDAKAKASADYEKLRTEFNIEIEKVYMGK